jgi:hypothetical protein
MSAFWDRLRRGLFGGRRPMAGLAPSAAARMAHELASTQEVEFDCEQVYQLLDQFAEAVLRGQDGAPWVPLIRAHLERCSDCRQEFEALLRVLQGAWA